MSEMLFKPLADGRPMVTGVAVFGHPQPDGPAIPGERTLGPTIGREVFKSICQDVKASNPKDAIGISKVPLCSVLPSQVMGEVALGMLEGALKYGRHNYRAIGVRTSVYVDAEQRHVKAFWEGQDTDPDSKLHHLAKAISTLVVLYDAILQDKCFDDRPPSEKNQGWVQDQNKRAAELIARYPDPKAPYTIHSVISKED